MQLISGADMETPDGPDLPVILYDLCLAWNWEYDAEFVSLLEAACRAWGLALLTVTPANLVAAVRALHDGRVSFRVFFDRASDTDERFLGLVRWARLAGLPCINSYERARCAWDKAAMHQALSATLPTPYTIVVPPYDEQPELPALDLVPLGTAFDVKPAHGGGGRGVVLGATTAEQVQRARQEFPADTYLLQAHVVPALLDGRPAWFRVLSCSGRVFPCWWHPQTHVYTPVTAEDEAAYGLGRLQSMAADIAEVCSLELFSCEIALTESGFVVVDYVNDPIDLRLQSRAADGVPDAIVHAVAAGLAEFVAGCCAPPG